MTGASPLLTIQAHSSGITGLAFSGDAKLLATTSRDDLVRLWDMTQAKPNLLATLRGHDDLIWSLAFTADAEILASASVLGKVRLCRVSTHDLIANLEAGMETWSLAFSPDGKTLAIGSGDVRRDGSFDPGEVILWDVSTKQIRVRLKGSGGPATSLAFHPGGNYMAVGSFDKTVRLWDLRKNHEAAVLKDHKSSVNSLSFSTNGILLASVSSESARLWGFDANTGELHPRQYLEIDYCLRFSPDYKTLATVSKDNRRLVSLWNVEKRSRIAILKLPGRGDLERLAFCPDGGTMVAGDQTGKVHIWDLPVAVRDLK